MSDQEEPTWSLPKPGHETVGVPRYSADVVSGEVAGSVVGPGDPPAVAATTAARTGAPWSAEECALVVARLRAGSAIEDIAAHLERTPGAIRARLCRMIPAN
jgi:hypothetical protein